MQVSFDERGVMKTLHGGPKGRTLHLVDLENLLGDRRKEAVALDGLRRYLARSRWEEGDQVLVAAHPEIIRQVGFAPPVPCSLHATAGDDAADQMLLAHAPVELIVRRYSRLVVGSGDGIFVARARAARAGGVGVAIVTRVDGCSTRFRRRGFSVLDFSIDGLEVADPVLNLAA
jgi:hypothetical protein